MKEYIIIHKDSEQKITLGYDNTFGMLRKVELSNTHWTWEDITVALRQANKLRSETDFLKRMESPIPDVREKAEDKARRRTDESFRKMLELMQNREDVMREIADHLKKERQKQENQTTFKCVLKQY